ncbi:FecR family protein [Pseudomonas wadenswilerensis]
MNSTDLPDEVIDQAITWLVRLESSDGEQIRAACLHWRQADPLHESAWQSLQHSDSAFRSLAALPGLPANVARDTLERLADGGHGRRQALKLLGLGAIVVAGGWGLRERGYRGADYVTVIGERRTFTLADGTRLQLNTGTAVDVHFTGDRRLIVLHRGEIFIDTAKDSARRSFWVESPQARLQALGTAFGVREEGQGTRLRVEDGVVAIHGRGEVHVGAGEEYLIDASGSQRVENSRMNASAWTRGQLVAKRMRLADLLEELSRYQRGWLGCDSSVAGLEVSGVFQLDAIDRALAALGDSLPVLVQRFTPLWIRLVPR